MWLLRVEQPWLGQREVRLTDRREYDQALRIDVIDALLTALGVAGSEQLEPDVLVGDPMGPTQPMRIVLQRPGTIDPHEEDQRWCGAALTALAARGVHGDFVVEAGGRSTILGR